MDKIRAQVRFRAVGSLAKLSTVFLNNNNVDDEGDNLSEQVIQEEETEHEG